VRSLEIKVDELTAQLRFGSRGPSSFSRLSEEPSSLVAEPDTPSADVGDTNTLAPADTDGRDGGPDNDELVDLNRHTNGVEFHGSTSSVALLGTVERLKGQLDSSPRPLRRASLISDLHNHGFSRDAIRGIDLVANGPDSRGYYFKNAYLFIDAYFTGIHYIHPFVDREEFLSRANALWAGTGEASDISFTALYFALLSFGALTRTWDEERLEGLTRFEWSRKLFAQAQACLNKLHYSTDLETVQCLYLMVSNTDNNQANDSGDCAELDC